MIRDGLEPVTSALDEEVERLDLAARGTPQAR